MNANQGMQNDSNRLRGRLRKTALLGAVVWILTIGLYFLVFHDGISPHQDVWGQFGDFLGGTLNPIFAFMTFIALLYTMALQADQVRQAEKSLEVTEEQLRIQTRDSHKQLTASVLLELRQIYSTDEMNRAVYYLHQLQKSSLVEFRSNRYSFARKYIETVESTSEEWVMRRRVSHFYSDVAALVEAGCIDVNDFFASYGSSCEIIDFLEPIEVAIAERISGGPYRHEWVALRLLSKCRDWRRNEELRGVDPKFRAPTDLEMYQQSWEN